MSEFLGPHGNATVVLMSAHFESELPKLKDLKKLLNVSDGKYYKSGGRHSSSIQQLETVLTIMAELSGDENVTKHSSNNYLITASEVYSNIFVKLKYTAEIVEGFNLTNDAMSELGKIIPCLTKLCSMQRDIEYFWTVLKRNAEKAKEMEFDDVTVLNPNLTALQEVLSTYGDSEYSKITTSIQAWYEKYRWKVKPPNVDADEAEAS
jgi:hypothetical protein